MDYEEDEPIGKYIRAVIDLHSSGGEVDRLTLELAEARAEIERLKTALREVRAVATSDENWVVMMREIRRTCDAYMTDGGA